MKPGVRAGFSIVCSAEGIPPVAMAKTRFFHPLLVYKLPPGRQGILFGANVFYPTNSACLSVPSTIAFIGRPAAHTRNIR